ncbi:hypothetical protein B7C42_03110 [Nocardia cerradoensis]|uniref:Mce/MlaD domain-containing protein n=1 Tax=Nocardia cerradoensis TaxID=85688 RepID=A0A231H814_9NOCA|nr:MlaD family protein [Nocardia cerradoensis]OXR45153.1 hypothetical protein B7C42_03110 [Nocardia cerradoensis]
MSGMAVIAVASVLCMNHLGLHFDIGENRRTATMAVRDTNGLALGSKVLLRGVEIGEVERMTPSASGVEVEWKYDDSYRIPVHSNFRVDTLSAMGESYIAVSPAATAGPYLPDHARIPSGDVTVPATIQDLSAHLTRLLDQVKPEQVRDIVAQLDIALPNHGVVLVDLSRAWSLFADMTLDRADDLTAVLTKFQALLADSTWISPDLAGSANIVRKFGVGFGDFLDSAVGTTRVAPLPEGISEGVGPFIDKLQQFLDKAAPDLQVLGVAILPSVRAASAAMRTVDISALLDRAIADSSGGAVTVHVGVPEPK